jgi:hypothetical protein
MPTSVLLTTALTATLHDTTAPSNDPTTARALPIVDSFACRMSVLRTIPKTPLYKRLQAEGRMLMPTEGPTLPLDLDHDEHLHWEGTDGRTNFRPLHLTMEELQQGQRMLYQKLYAPDAFQERLFGNLRRFENPGRSWTNRVGLARHPGVIVLGHSLP